MTLTEQQRFKCYTEMCLFAQTKGGECLSIEYKNAHSSYTWFCKKDFYMWNTSWNNVKFGNCWCPKCANRPKITIDKCHELAFNKNGKCLSTKYFNSKTPILWQCEKGHVWESTWLGVAIQGHWCHECGNQIPYTLEDCVQIAKDRNGVCLSTDYNDANSILLWKCNKDGYEWKTTLSSIVNGKTWCPKCVNLASPTIKEIELFAKNKGWTFLSENYVNNRTNMEWQCQKGHKWKATWNNIKDAKRECPNCCLNQTSKMEQELYQFVLKIRPNALNGKKGLLNNKKMSLDVFDPDTRRAIEFDGDYFHSFRNKRYSPEREFEKHLQCIEADIILIRIKEKDWNINKNKILSKVEAFLNG